MSDWSDSFGGAGSFTSVFDGARAEWSAKRAGAPVVTYTCDVCGFKVTSDTHIRFDEMCEHYRPAPGYTYPWDTYAAIIGNEPVPQ